MIHVDSWIAGFVDGEGCFSIQFNPNREMKFGLQVQAEFAVTQAISSIDSLKLIQTRFACGNLQVNRRTDRRHEDLVIYRVRKLDDLVDVVVPFFQTNDLQTSKKEQFQFFSQVVSMMSRKEHLTDVGFRTIRGIANRMNQRAKQIGESGILRDDTPGTSQEVKIESELHGDM